VRRIPYGRNLCFLDRLYMIKKSIMIAMDPIETGRRMGVSCAVTGFGIHKAVPVPN
jgi:hypothetical protein